MAELELELIQTRLTKTPLGVGLCRRACGARNIKTGGGGSTGGGGQGVIVAWRPWVYVILKLQGPFGAVSFLCVVLPLLGLSPPPPPPLVTRHTQVDRIEKAN
jgi:hypothetical protein